MQFMARFALLVHGHGIIFMASKFCANFYSKSVKRDPIRNLLQRETLAKLQDNETVYFHCMEVKEVDQNRKKRDNVPSLKAE